MKFLLLILILLPLMGCEFVRSLTGAAASTEDMAEDGAAMTKIVREFMYESLIPTGVIGLMYLRSLWVVRKLKKANGQVVIPEDPVS